MEYKKNRMYFIILYFISYVSFSYVITNFTPFLSHLGYNTMERGILLSSYAITTVIFQLLFGILSDKSQKIKKIIILSIGIYTISSFILFMQTNQMFSIHLILIALSGGAVNTLCGLHDTWILNCDVTLRDNLPLIKAFGSIGWALGSVIASYMIYWLTYQGMAYSLIIISCLLFINIYPLPEMQKTKHQQKIDFKDVIALCNNKKYCLLVFILLLMYSIVIANNSTVIDKMLALHASNSQISLKWSLQSVLEIPTYALGFIVLKRYNHFSLLKVSSLAITIQFILFAICQTVESIIYLSLFQMFSTPLILITSKAIIFEICDEKLRNSSQLIALSIFIGIPSLITPTVAGMLSLYVGIDITLLLMASLGIVSFILISFVSKIKSYN